MNSKSIKIILKNKDIFDNDPIDGVSINEIDEINPYIWNIIIIGPKDTPYEGGLFYATIKFPNNYPLYPPEFKFINPPYHPNIYDDGKVCISILHPPGDDDWGYEKSEERWRPIHTFNSIIISIMSLLSSPNDESPANIEAAKLWRNDKIKFQEKVNNCVKKSLEKVDF